jgi:hypothetical protein
MYLWHLLPHQLWRDPGKEWRISWSRLALACLFLTAMSFMTVHAYLNMPKSEEERFMEACRQLGGVLVRNGDGVTMDAKALCIQRDALLGLLER